MDGEVAGFTTYRVEDGAYRLVHTEVDPKFEGQGLGSRLAAGIFGALRGRGVDVIPECEFIRGYIGKHPEYAELVPERWREHFGLAAGTSA